MTAVTGTQTSALSTFLSWLLLLGPVLLLGWLAWRMTRGAGRGL